MINHDLNLNDMVLHHVLSRRGFWIEYFWLADFTPEELASLHPDCTACEWWVSEADENNPAIIEDRSVAIALWGGYQLLLELVGDLQSITLSLVSPKHPEPIVLAWDEQTCFHPWVLHWAELETLYRYLSLTHSKQEVDFFLLLLYRFCPITTKDTWQQAEPLLTGAWSNTQLFSKLEMKCLMAIAIKNTLTWKIHPQYGWVLEGWDAYSLRNAGNPDYPFEEWNRLMVSIQNMISHEHT